MPKEIKYNAAQSTLIAIGGTAVLVGGYKNNAIPDLQTPKQVKPAKKIHYGEAIRASYALKRAEALAAKAQ